MRYSVKYFQNLYYLLKYAKYFCLDTEIYLIYKKCIQTRESTHGTHLFNISTFQKFCLKYTYIIITLYYVILEEMLLAVQETLLITKI